MKAYKHTDDTRLALLEQSIEFIKQDLRRLENLLEQLKDKIK